MNTIHDSNYAYGMWAAVIFQTVIFVWFLISFATPKSKTEWKSFGYLTGFLVALFVEMYGFPLTIYLLVSWLGSKYPAVNPFSHESGHLLGVFLGVGGGHSSFLHLLSNFFIFSGILIVAAGWRRIHSSYGRLVKEGPYAYVRHPQYAGFILVILGFLIQWPTFITILMTPILIYRYLRLARKEEKDMKKAFGAEYESYALVTPRFLPSWRFIGERNSEGKEPEKSSVRKAGPICH